MSVKVFLSVGLFMVFMLGVSSVAKAEQPPVLVELFSSQGCPQCPKAEAVMGDIAEMDNVIALNCHVDYMRVKDKSLPKPICTQRQTQYVELFDSGTHYTPQMVVNGHMDVVGHKKDKIAAALLKGRADKVARINVKKVADGVYQFTLPPVNLNGRAAALWLAVIDEPQNRVFKRKNMTYTNIVNAMGVIGEWRGQAFVKAIAPVMNSGSKGFVIFAQDQSSGKIIAAGQALRN